MFQQKKQNTGKGGKKKKQVLKFTLDCTHPVEDGIMDAANFVSPCLYLQLKCEKQEGLLFLGNRGCKGNTGAAELIII